jgi:hypothetical protein
MMKNNTSIRIILKFLMLLNPIFLYGQLQSPLRNPELSQFESYKRFTGQPFSLYVDLVSQNSTPVSRGLIYSSIEKSQLTQSYGDSITPWEGAVCYFPKAIWGNNEEKIKYAKDDKNWIDLVCIQGGDFIGTSYLYRCVEMSELNEILGVWYLSPLGTGESRDGNWWNGIQFEDVTGKFISYYIKFK